MQKIKEREECVSCSDTGVFKKEQEKNKLNERRVPWGGSINL
jgi:hypothetical protein